MDALHLDENVGSFLGNFLFSLIGLVFTAGAPAPNIYKAKKKWWIAFWVFILCFYLLQCVLGFLNISSLFGFFSSVLLNNFSSGVILILFLNYYSGKGGKLKLATILSLFLVVIISILDSFLWSNYLQWNGYFTLFWAWLSFMLLAWSHRKVHITTSILIIGYANLQLPSILIGGSEIGNDFVLLIAAKLSLIGAVYQMLGVQKANENILSE